eukprot:3354664-Rhodomonas_salina.3
MGAAASAVNKSRGPNGQAGTQVPGVSENGLESASVSEIDRIHSSSDDSFSHRTAKSRGKMAKTPEEKLNMIGPSRRVLSTLETKQAASIDAQINDDLTPAENAANILELILKFPQETRRYDAKTKAGLNYALHVLKLGSGASAAPQGFQAITNGAVTAH